MSQNGLLESETRSASKLVLSDWVENNREENEPVKQAALPRRPGFDEAPVVLLMAASHAAIALCFRQAGY